MSGVRTLAVAASEADMRLDRWFKTHFPGVTFVRLQKLLRTGQIRVDGKRAQTNQRLAAGQAIRIPPLDDDATVKPVPTGPKPAPQLGTRDEKAVRAMVLYRDDAVIVLDKPPGLSVQGGEKQTRHLDAMLDVFADGENRPKLVHRLDKDTSGVLLLARTAPAARTLAETFRGRGALKQYWAVTAGVPKHPAGRINAALIKAAGAGGREKQTVADRDDEDAKWALTHYAVVDQAGRQAAWLALWPRTGRTHQLRVHCQATGTPILGDGKYGGQAAFLGGVDLPRKLHLHARRLTLPHPGGRGLIDVTAPLPAHMKTTFDLLGFIEADGRDLVPPFEDA